jgi:hypothetical protein
VAQVLGVCFLEEDNMGALLLLAESIDAVTDRPAKDVVAEQDDDSVAADELFRETERLGDAARLVLVRSRS